MALKILMGDVPELMEVIFNNLNDNHYSLYSCALVNRHWCKISTPILWQNPFLFDQKPTFISRYFSHLDENEKLVLKEYGLTIDFPNTMFHYAKFLKVLDLFSLESKVNEWINLRFNNSFGCTNRLKDNLANLLFKLFIESGATLSTLDLYISRFILKPEVIFSLRKNGQFFSQLQNISIITVPDMLSIEETHELLKILATNATKINNLEITNVYESRFCHELANLIRSQKQLKQFNLSSREKLQTEFYGIISALESQKKSLQEVRILNCAYSTEFEGSINYESLETLRIVCWEEQQLLKMLNTDFSKISSLEICCSPIDTANVSQILKKAGPLLQQLKLDSMNEGICLQSLLLETIMTFCPNIIYLNISFIEFSTQLLKLIDSLQRLQFLSLSLTDREPEEVVITHVIQLAKILPLTLQYLDWEILQSDSYIDILLNHCDAPLKRLIIYGDCDAEKTINALIGFCERKRTLNYLNCNRSYDFDDDNWNILKKNLEGYAKLMPYDSIVVDI